MTVENAFLAGLRRIATDSGARGLLDDVAVLGDLVLTHDMIVEGVHFLPDDSPADVAWKLVAVNLSDLAAKGAVPLGILAGTGLTRDADWNAAFVDGLGEATRGMGVPLLGGDTVVMPEGAPRTFGLTAIGRVTVAPPSRIGAAPGDVLYVAGVIGDAGLGLEIALGKQEGPDSLLSAYRRPMPLLASGQALAGHVTAMMDVSDGLLIDAARLAQASGASVLIDIDAVPLSKDAATFGTDRNARLRAASAGDDYALLFTASLPPPHVADRVTRIGQIVRGSGLQLVDADGPIPLPERLGWLHG